MALYKIHYNVLNNVKIGQTLKSIFYNMMSFSGHPVCHLGLIWCILLGVFYVLLPNLWVW